MNPVIFFLAGLIVPSAFSQECIITSGLEQNIFIYIGRSGEDITPIDEDISRDVVLWAGSLSSKGIGVIIANRPPGSENIIDDLLEYVVTDRNEFLIRPGPEFANYIDIMRNGDFVQLIIRVQCEGGSISPGAIVYVYIESVNNKVPEFNPNTPMLINNIKVPWNIDIPLNDAIPLKVTDEDYEVGVLNKVDVSDGFRIDWNYTSDVKLFSNNEIFESTTVTITASDGDYSTSLTVEIKVSETQNYCPPVFTASHYKRGSPPTAGDGFLITEFSASNTDGVPGVTIDYSTNDPKVKINSTDPPTVSFIDASHLPGRNELPYHFEITAREVGDGGTAKESSVLVLLDYCDSEEETVFQENFYKFSIPAGTPIGKIGDIGLTGDHQIGFKDGSDPYFDINGKEISLRVIPEPGDLNNGLHVVSVVPTGPGATDSKQHSTLFFLFEDFEESGTT